jgi:hypothetical protein
MSAGPKLDDLFLRASLLMDPRVQMLEPLGLQILLRLVSSYAATLVWTYSPPSEGGLPDDDVRLARLSGVDLDDWQSHRGEVVRFFSVRDGRWRLREDWIELSPQIGTKRPAISAARRAAVLSASNYRCGYCGSPDGPFDLDHVIPVSQGGSNDDENLIAACWRCNRSKGGRTPEEWLS